MGRHTFLEAQWPSPEGQKQALRHAKGAVDRSAWFLALLRRDLGEVPGAGPIRRWHMRGLLADLGDQQASLSSDYFGMAIMPPGESLGMQLKDFFAAYDRFLDAVRVARMDWRSDYENAPGSCPDGPFQIGCGLPIGTAHDRNSDAAPNDKA